MKLKTFLCSILTIIPALMLPSRPLHAAEPAGKEIQPFRLICYNIHHGEGMDGKVDLERIAAFLRASRPDAVALQEVDRHCARTGRVDQAAELGRLMGMTATFQKAMDFDGGEYGICILTKNPPLAAGRIPLPDGAEPRVGQWVKVAGPGGGHLTLANTHLDAGPEDGRLAQAKALTAKLAELPGTILLAGDFNAVRGDAVMTAVAGAGWEIPLKQGPAATVPVQNPRREIDFVVIHPAGALRIGKYVVLDEAVASDHRAILIEAPAPD